MDFKNQLARKIIASGLYVAAAFPFLRRLMVPLRPIVTRLAYGKRSWDYLGHLSSERYKNSQISLIQAPGWGVNTPPLAIAILASYLREKGIKVLPVDINVAMFNKNEDKYGDAWAHSIDDFWENKSKIDIFIEENRDELGLYIDLIIQSGVRVVGFTIFDSSYLVSSYIAKELKERDKDIFVVFGGAGSSEAVTGRNILKENEFVDIVVEGEGELTLFEIVGRILEERSLDGCLGAVYRKDRKIVRNPPRTFIKDIDVLPTPDFSDFNFFQYREPFKCPVESSRGCINKCIFCNERTYWKMFRYRTGSSIFKEMKRQLDKYPHITYFEFHDSLVNGNVKELDNLANLIVENRMRIFWGGQATMRKEMTYDFLLKLKKSGCASLAFGLESTSKTLLEKVGKYFSKKADIDQIVRDSYRIGIACGLNFMFGLPGETDEEADENIEFIRRNAKYIYTINPSLAFCLIFPGTDAYENPEKYGIDLSKGPSYWSSDDNTYVKRLERFEKFVSEVHRLKIPCLYPYPKIKNRNELIGNYYFAIGEYGKAVPYYKESLKEESFPKQISDNLQVCLKNIDNKASES